MVFSILVILSHFCVRWTGIRWGEVKNPLKLLWAQWAALIYWPICAGTKQNLQVVHFLSNSIVEKNFCFHTYNSWCSIQWLQYHTSGPESGADHVFPVECPISWKKKLCVPLPTQFSVDSCLHTYTKTQYLTISGVHMCTCGPRQFSWWGLENPHWRPLFKSIFDNSRKSNG